jgi:HlyD family secretion protein
MKRLFLLILVLAVAGGVAFQYWRRSADPAMSFRTAPVARGDLLITISATGTVEPIEVIDVGAQVAGKIGTFGTDPDGSGKPIDYGTAVAEDTVLAQIDDSLYAADVQQATAQLEQAKANVKRAEADLVQMQAKLHQAEQNWKRAQELGPSRALSATEADLVQMQAKLHQAEQNWKRAQELGPSRALSATDFESYQANYETAKATVAVGEATIVQTQKTVLQAEAALERSKINHGYCTIRSPVKGVIIDRRVNIGQTVVASLNAPSLFLIAKDLTRMQVWAAVNEADIGSIHPGQPVGFTVDAYPGRLFRGEVGKIRLNASMTQNVVTYTVEINTDNSDRKLLPYLTANVRFEVEKREDVLTVPNAALRWRPSQRQIAPDVDREALNLGGRNRPGSRERTTGPSSRPAGPAHDVVWTPDGALVRPVTVTVGLSDGLMTEVQSDRLQKDDTVVVGESEQTEQGGTTSPFTPRLFGGRRGG